MIKVSFQTVRERKEMLEKGRDERFLFPLNTKLYIKTHDSSALIQTLSIQII